MKKISILSIISPLAFVATAYAVSDAEVEKAKQDIAEYERLKEATKENEKKDSSDTSQGMTSQDDTTAAVNQGRTSDYRNAYPDNPPYYREQTPSEGIGNEPINTPRGTTTTD